jgi:hypothetical protein
MRAITILIWIVIIMIIILIVKLNLDKSTNVTYPRRYIAGRKYDYIIVGLGTAGSVLTRRLSEYNPTARILVLERGRDQSQSPIIYNNANGVIAAYTKPYSEVLTNKSSPAPISVATMIGGGSSHNYGLVVHGSISFYKKEYPELTEYEIRRLWRQVRNTVEVSPLPVSVNLVDQIVPFLEQLDSNWWRNYLTARHSWTTYRSVGPLRASTCFSNILIDSLRSVSANPPVITKDYNYCHHDVCISADPQLYVSGATGLRSSADVAYLGGDYLTCCGKKVTVVTDANVKMVSRSCDGKQATGIIWEDHYGISHSETLADNGRVILSAGAIHSPKLLFASGFNFTATLLNHYGTTLIFRVPVRDVGSDFSEGPLAFLNETAAPNREWELVVGGSSLLNPALVPYPVTECIKSKWVYVSLLLWLLNPKIRGSVSPSGEDTPFIDYPMFSHPDDVAQCKQGLVFMKSLYDKVKQTLHRAQLVFPPETSFLPGRDEELESDMIKGVTMTDHYSGTCASLLNTNFKHRFSLTDTPNLSVVDTSAARFIADGNTEFSVLVMAELASKILSQTQNK